MQSHTGRTHHNSDIVSQINYSISLTDVNSHEMHFKLSQTIILFFIIIWYCHGCQTCNEKNLDLSKSRYYFLKYLENKLVYRQSLHFIKEMLHTEILFFSKLPAHSFTYLKNFEEMLENIIKTMQAMQDGT